MPVRRRVLCALATAGIAVAGCAGPTTPPTPTSRPSTTTEAPRPTTAPVVGEPIDLRPHRLHSCGLLNARQLLDLGFPPQTFEGAVAESGLCKWNSDYRYALEVYVTGDPLAAAYRDSNLRDNGKLRWPLFEPRTIRGLPALVHSRFPPPKSFCEVVVSTGNGQGIEVTGVVSAGDYEPGLCDRLVTAAGLVIDAVQR